MARPVNLFTIPAGAPFTDELAKGVIARHGRPDDPLALANVLILVPTRRAIDALGAAFARAAGGITVLPRIRALGDWDDEPELLTDDGTFAGEAVPDLPPPISPLRRQLLLATLIRTWSLSEAAAEHQRGYGSPPALALALARDLARLLDQAAAENLAWERLRDLVPADFAGHWETTLRFLAIVTDLWPALLAAEGRSDPVVHRDAALRRAAEAWTKSPPPYPVIAAGSTGSVPATAALLKAIANMEKGAVILPGLDLATDDDTWRALTAGHPQAGMRDLIDKFEATRRDVQPWTDVTGNPARSVLLREALRQADTTADWRQAIDAEKAAIAEGARNMRSVTARTPMEEAQVIALALRRAADDPQATAALVTPDRALARRVAAELKRWNITIDDSGGTPLSKTIPGRFLLLVAEVAAERLAPVPLLALLKHPLTQLGYKDRADLRFAVETFERDVLRGPRPAPGFAGLRAALTDLQKRSFADVVDRLEEALAGLAAESTRPLRDMAALHRAAAEGLAAVAKLWDQEAGRAARDLFDALDTESADIGLELTATEYVEVVRALMDAIPVRLRGHRHPHHPRLHIWGPLEARMQQADLMILGGLNEGVWPPLADPGPWLNRPMRDALELSQPERRVGLSAHDFVQAASSRSALLTRSEKDAGAPTTASRWLTRIGIVLDGAGLGGTLADTELLALARALDRPRHERALGAPRPCPPVDARPRALPVTDIERWIRDPYALYAKRVLKLRPLDPIDDTPAAAERGMAIHAALDLFTKQYPALLPDDDEAAYQALLAYGRAAFGEMLTRPGVAAFWWPRFERMAKWLIAFERERRVAGMQIVSEQSGALPLPGLDFEVHAKADRLETWPDGTAAVIDYKTGSAPTAAQIVSNLAPQIPLEAAMVLGNAFAGVNATSIRQMLIVQLKGDVAGGKLIDVMGARNASSPDQIADAALQGLARLVAQYDDRAMPYLARLRVIFERVEGDYDHLARVMEWSSGDDNVE